MTTPDLEACLPEHLRGPATSITRVAAGLSGAGVYRVVAGEQTFALKVGLTSEALEPWHRKLRVQRLAVEAGLAPRIVHVDETRRAILSEFVVDKGFALFWLNPATREQALLQIGQTLRRAHDLPLPPDVPAPDGRALLGQLSSSLGKNAAVPAFVGDALKQMLAEEVPARERPLVLSHNDVNPTNLVYDGANLLLLDWDTAGANDPLYDLAAIAMFLRMNDETCLKLLSAYEGTTVSNLPAGFGYNRRLVAALCGAILLHLATTGGYEGASGQLTLDTAPSLADFYQRARAGGLSVAKPDGQWLFGLALVKTSTER